MKFAAPSGDADIINQIRRNTISLDPTYMAKSSWPKRDSPDPKGFLGSVKLRVKH